MKGTGMWVPVLLAGVLGMSDSLAAPGDVIYAVSFENQLPNGWSKTGGSGITGVGEFPDGSASWSFFTCCGPVTVDSPVIDTTSPAAQVSIRMQIGGANIGSQRPEEEDYLDVYFRDADGNWQFVHNYPGGGTSGQMFADTFDLAESFRHAGFGIRLAQADGNPPNSDYWHLHEVSIIETSPSGGIGNLCDDFESGLSNWEIDTLGGNGRAAITSHTSNSGSHSLALYANTVNVTSRRLDLSKAASAVFNVWVRRGSNAFSNRPEAGEDFSLSYLDDEGTWVELAYLTGSGAAGQIRNLSFSLPSNARHDDFRVRFSMLQGSGGENDFWHVDDACLSIDRTIDHFAIIHDGSGVNCQAEPVQLVAHDVDHFVVENHAGTVTLSTSTGNGDWSTLGANGFVTSAGNGLGNYTFVESDKGAAVLGLRNSYLESVNVDVAQGEITEFVNEDPDLSYTASGFNFLVNGVPSLIGSQIANKPSDVMPDAATISLQAIRTSDETGACEAAFQDDVHVELAFTCENPGHCSGRNIIANGVAIAANSSGSPVSHTTLALNFGDENQDRADIVFLYEDAGSVRLHARHALSPSGEVMMGASNTFTVRPFGFHVQVDEGSITSFNPGASGGNGAAFEKAGLPFRVTATAVGWQAGDDVDVDGVPDGHDDNDPANNADLSDNLVLPNFGKESFDADSVSLSARLVIPSEGMSPGLTGSTTISGFMNGTGSASNVIWPEAGIIEIDVSINDSDYQGAGNVISRSGNVGRFIPHHYTTEVSLHGCSNVHDFTYSAQPLGELKIYARNLAGTVTLNHDGDAGLPRDLIVSEVNGLNGSVLNAAVSGLDFVNGIAGITANSSGVGFAFLNKESAPAIVAFRVVDEDGVSSEGHPEGTTQVRSARFVIDDASAFVFAAAHSAVYVESYNGTAWGPELQDTCTALDSGSLSLQNHGGNLGSGESIVSETSFINGVGQVTLSAPGVGNDGSMELHYNTEPWLEFDWKGVGEHGPSGLIRFHTVYGTEPGLIYRREVVH